MKKTILIILAILMCGGIVLGLTRCVITDNSDAYERKEFKSREDINKVIVDDESAEVIFKVADNNELSIEYAESLTKSWYNISVENGILKIEKVENTVGVEDNSLIISLPNKNYEEILVKTTNGNITFENISSKIYRCNNQNGNIKGTIYGDPAEYLSVISVENGSSNLKNNVIKSEKMIELNVKNGDIKIEFLQ